MQGHYSERAVTSIVLPVLLTALATIMVVLRITGRRIKRVPLWLDDYAIIASLCFVYPLMILIVLSATTFGAGRHMQDLSLDTCAFLYKGLIAIELTWCVSVVLIKLGILLFYLRILIAKKDRIATFVMIGVAMCWVLSTVLGAVLQCRPFSYGWNKRQKGHCNGMTSFWLAIGLSHIVIDVIILLLPVHMLWKLQVPRTTKRGLYVLFGLGSLICIISGFRLRAIKSMANSRDLSYEILLPHIWSMLEPTVAICTACLPVARPVFLRVFFFSSTSQPPIRQNLKPKSSEPYGTAEEAAAGTFVQLNEHEISLKEIATNQVIACQDSKDDLEIPPSKQGMERDLD